MELLEQRVLQPCGRWARRQRQCQVLKPAKKRGWKRCILCTKKISHCYGARAREEKGAHAKPHVGSTGPLWSGSTLFILVCIPLASNSGTRAELRVCGSVYLYGGRSAVL